MKVGWKERKEECREEEGKERRRKATLGSRREGRGPTG